MRRRFRSGMLLAGLVPAIVQAAPLPRLLEGAAGITLPDFSYAGFGFGLADLPADRGTVIDVTAHGARADDDVDDTQAVLKAMDAANAVAGKVTLRFPAGRFIISDVIRIERGDFVLEGAGPGAGGTELFFPRPLRMVDHTTEFDELRQYLVAEDKREVQPKANLNARFSEYSWSGGFVRTGPKGNRTAPYLAAYDTPFTLLADGLRGRQGDRSFTVVSAGDLQVGQVVQLQWYPDKGRDSAIIKSLYGDTTLKIGSHHWSFPTRPTVTQSTRITAIAGNRITIGDPLLHDATPAQPARLAAWRHLERVGIQGLRFTFPDSPWFGHHQEQGYNAIFFTGVFDGWVRDVRIHNADSGILTYDSASVTYRDIVVSGNRRAHYAIHVGTAHNILATGLIIEAPILHSLSVNTQSTRAVFQRAVVRSEPVLDQHAGSNHQNLFDNVTLHITPRRIDGVPTFDLWDGSGAGYWQPGHGRYNTSWNIRVVVEGDVAPDETVLLRGLDEGPEARVVGVWGNRPVRVDYRPMPYLEMIGAEPVAVPSLYDWQLARRRSPR